MAVERKYERDIDIFLAEEFSVNPHFAEWFIQQTSFAGSNYAVLDVWVSKATAEGESDLIILARDLREDRNVAIFIEDKIDASFMKEQEKRYRQRAEKGRDDGEFAAFTVVLCAPKAYPSRHPESAFFDSFISYEAIAAWLRDHGNEPRSQYRAKFIETAADAAKNAWVRTEDVATNLFWDTVYNFTRSAYPEFEMKEPRFSKGQKWLTLSPSIFPRGKLLIQILIKGSKGFVDLGFLYADALTLKRHLDHLLPHGMTIQQAGQGAVIRSYGRPYEVTGDLEPALAAIKDCLARAKELLEFFKANQAAILDAGRLAYEATTKAGTG